LDFHESEIPANLKNPAKIPVQTSPRVQLDAPTILSVLGTANSFTVTWSAVPEAYSYTVQYSKDPMFATGAQTGIVNAPLTSYTVAGREPDTIYYVRVKSYPNLPGDDTASDYSTAQSVRTLSLGSGGSTNVDVVKQLQGWLNNQQAMNAVIMHDIPQLAGATLSTLERRRLMGSGVKRYGYIDKVSDTASAYSQFWPADVVELDVLKEKLREIEVLRNLAVLFRWLTRVCEDRFLIVSDEAFQLANAYYGSVRIAARRKAPEAEQVFQLLRSFWNRPRKSSGDPTQKKVVSKVKALQNGTLQGEMLVKNVNDTIIEGDKLVLDYTYPKGCGMRGKEQSFVDASLNTNSVSVDKGK
jgi:hypothetical protein